MNPTFDVISSLQLDPLLRGHWPPISAATARLPGESSTGWLSLLPRFKVLDVLECSGDILCPQALVIRPPVAVLKLRQPHRSPWAMLVALFWVAVLGWDAGRWCSQDWRWQLAPRSCCWLHQGDGCHDCHNGWKSKDSTIRSNCLAVQT